ncbi:heparinase II/III family protein [Coraliomargarita sp. SDUM461004]|uniref:Heparinase II/III family protein n=1 Tax=Thalassobacterium sedimentorum TaxID=3041258 RepID=A0ABU1AIM2_9BACT|nr:heparinase II/III family protein [Coraliomargarita sp. SDUM461004]MDQ8194660.1 heparinase II/III family protein [Coraliomargarita sp. SDUM461004]
MPLFLSDSERAAFRALQYEDPLSSIYWALSSRVEKRASAPGLIDAQTTVHWWHCASEYLTDAAMVYALKPSEPLACWLRNCTMEIVRRPVSDWVGPPFRDHTAEPPLGHLETAHLTWSVAIVLDLAADLFEPVELDEIRSALRDKGIALCQRWIDKTTYLNNWRCVMNAGIATAAAVLDDSVALSEAIAAFQRDVDVFQKDGSYGESLQYGNYTSYCLMLTREAIVRHSPSLDADLALDPYVKKPRWDVASLFYKKPLQGWGIHPRPRSANFNDSAAMYRASGDFLLHVAVRAQKSHPIEAGLARWLFDTLYLPSFEQGPHDQASFGFINDFGFLTLPLFAQACAAISPEAAELPLTDAFSCGDVLVRDDWPSRGGRTVLAIHGADQGLHAPGHLHGDLNSFILVHNNERMLVDPGHSCYRGLVHGIETSTNTHNTCTFSEAGKSMLQSKYLRRQYDPKTKQAGPLVTRGGKQLLVARKGEVSVVASEVSALYGDPIQEFTRFWFQCGTHALFIVDHIEASRPVRTHWNWLLNNRDNALDLKLVQPDRLVARRANAGMKLFHLGGHEMQGPTASYVHDAYHPLPNQNSEGKANSGQLITWSEREPQLSRTVTHAICLDSYGPITRWHLHCDDTSTALESEGAKVNWKLSGDVDTDGFTLSETVSNISYRISQEQGTWQLRRK